MAERSGEVRAPVGSGSGSNTMAGSRLSVSSSGASSSASPRTVGRIRFLVVIRPHKVRPSPQPVRRRRRAKNYSRCRRTQTALSGLGRQWAG